MGLCLVPITCTLGMAYLLSSPTLFAVASFRLLRNALNFAIARPSKELLFTGMMRGRTGKCRLSVCESFGCPHLLPTS